MVINIHYHQHNALMINIKHYLPATLLAQCWPLICSVQSFFFRYVDELVVSKPRYLLKKTRDLF